MSVIESVTESLRGLEYGAGSFAKGTYVDVIGNHEGPDGLPWQPKA